jgi:hypothetical protein
MSSCPILCFNNVTPTVWQAIVARAATYGVTISSDTGSATVHGFTVAWNYFPSKQTGNIQCTDSPWWAPCSTINSKISTEIEGCGADLTSC